MRFSFSWFLMLYVDFYQRSAFLESVWKRCLYALETKVGHRSVPPGFHGKITLYLSRAGQGGNTGGTWLSCEEMQHDMECSSWTFFLLKTSILRINYVVYLFNKQNIFLLIINWLIDWLKLINEYYGIFFLRFQGSKVWIIVLNKANSPIYDDKQCYDNRNDDVGNELDNLK